MAMYKSVVSVLNAAVKPNWVISKRGIKFKMPWSNRFSAIDDDDDDDPFEFTKRKQTPEDTNLKHHIKLLAVKTKLTNKRGYEPPENAEERMKDIVESLCAVKDTNWRDVSLENRRLKFKVLTRFIDEFEHDVPASVLSNVRIVDDIVEHFVTPVHETTALEDLANTKLPKNMHVEQEYHRFNPDDPLFGGRDAFPGSDTYVTSIKYGRKYKSIKTTQEKPGYWDHYRDHLNTKIYK